MTTATVRPTPGADRARTEIVADLASLELFAGLDDAAVSRFAEALEAREYQAGEVLMRQGAMGTSFLILLDGFVTVSRADSRGPHSLGTAARGATLGELALLTGGLRQATVTATSSVRAVTGDEQALQLLLDSPGMHELLAGVVALRLAVVADRAPVPVSGGSRVTIRPLLPGDSHDLASAFARQPPESIRRRFFTAARPNSRMIDYLVNIDYVDHFAWGLTSDDGARTVAEGRYIRRQEDHRAADVAFDVFDDYQGRGLGTLLLGALAVAASNAGINRFVAEVLYENRPMLAVLRKAGATWKHDEPGVLTGSVDVKAAGRLVRGPLRSELDRMVRPVVTAAGLARHAA